MGAVLQVTGEGETDGLSTIGPLRMGARALVALVLPPIHQLQLTL